MRDSVEDYSWEELSDIAGQIAGACFDWLGLEVAKRFHLCAGDGTLDGTQLKSFELSDGGKAQAQIIGFRHDDRADGSGKAGITFITRDCVAQHAMNPSEDNHGGWEGCQMRSWMNSDLLGMLPEDLASAIVPVEKMTNNAGVTEDASSVTATEDSLWLPSYVELVGTDQLFDDVYGEIEAAEGSQYQLYSDESVQRDVANDVLVKKLNGKAAYWRLRSPDSFDLGFFCEVGSDGVSCYYLTADSSGGVAPGFCL